MEDIPEPAPLPEPTLTPTPKPEPSPISKPEAETEASTFSLIDVSGPDNDDDDDNFLLPSSSTSEPEGGTSTTTNNSCNKFKGNNVFVESPIQRKTNKCNLRKSLAWDSAFFTSAGVLDSEELSSMIEGQGGDNSVKRTPALAGIQEEMSKSTDSISTFESDNLALESLEADLFRDVRASIQRSSKASSFGNYSSVKVHENDVRVRPALVGIQEDLSKSTDSFSTFESENLGLDSLEADLFRDVRASIQRCSKPSPSGSRGSQNGQRQESPGNKSSAKTPETSSGKLVKSKSDSTKLMSAVGASAKTLKSGSLNRQVPKCESESDSDLYSKPIVRSKESRTLPPLTPDVAGKSNARAAATKKIPAVGGGRVHIEGNSARNTKLAGKPASSVRVTDHVAAKNTISKPLVLKSASGSSVLRPPTRSLGSSCDSSSSLNVRKSQADTIRRKNANVPTGPKIKTVSRVPVKSKSQNVDPNLSEYLKSSSNPSSSVSPASSISELSAESFCSTASFTQRPDHVKPRPTSCEDVSSDAGVTQNPAETRSCERALSVSGRVNEVAGTLGKSAKQPSVQGGMSLSRPGTAKPSGLRMPSAKIGFFDGGEAGARTKRALPSSIPRPGAGS